MFELLLSIVSMLVFFLMYMLDRKAASNASREAKDLIKEWQSTDS